MNRNLVIKLVTIALLMLFLIIPIEMISGIVNERQQRRDEVVKDIARSSAYQQKLTGPLLVVPYTRTLRTWRENTETHERTQEESQMAGCLYFLPEVFEVNGNLQLETRNRGIYQARLYHASNQIKGHFVVPADWGISESIEDYRFGNPYLAIGISDIRGIENAMALKINASTIKFEPGAQVEFLGSGVHAMLPVKAAKEAARFDYALDMKLQGTEQFHLAPVGRESTVTMTSDWPHPGFVGDFLPVERNIDTTGFSARWQTSFFSTNMEEELRQCVVRGQCEGFQSIQFGVDLVDPVDQYLKSDRAIKYALLFVALTFAGFFLYEVLKRLAVHPVQYGLVGMALAFFYLLLLSLSEHIGFFNAYLISSTACVLLIGSYVVSVLRSIGRGVGFGVGLAVLYTMLYGLLSAEDYALLMGSLLLFGLLGVVMMLTRKVDWFSVGRAPHREPTMDAS